VSWSQIARIAKTDKIDSDSFMFGDRDRYAIAVFYEDGVSATWNSSAIRNFGTKFSP
jgi:hypothetical protein